MFLITKFEDFCFCGTFQIYVLQLLLSNNQITAKDIHIPQFNAVCLRHKLRCIDPDTQGGSVSVTHKVKYRAVQSVWRHKIGTWFTAAGPGLLWSRGEV